MSNEFDVDLDRVKLESGQRIMVHAQKYCIGRFCSIHDPMPGPWESWPRYWRHDRLIMERICPHGVGHPAVEQLRWWDLTGRSYMAIHGCDGCPCIPVQDEEGPHGSEDDA